MEKFLIMAIAAIFLAACSGTPDEREVNVEDADFSGFAGKYLEVVDGTYKFTTAGREGKITVKLRKKEHPYEPYHFKSFAELRLNATGDAGEVFDTGVYGFEADNAEFNKVKDLMENGEVGDTRSICFTWRYKSLKDDKEIANKIYTQSTGIELIDNGFEAGEEPEKENKAVKDEEPVAGDDYDIIMAEAEMEEAGIEDDTETTSSKSGLSSAEIDKFLDKYEKALNSALKYYKKAQSGDMSAMAEYSKFMKEYTDMHSEADKLKLSDMSSSQMNRLQNILMKYSQEVQSMY